MGKERERIRDAYLGLEEEGVEGGKEGKAVESVTF